MPKEKKAYVYILANDRVNVLYIGSTADFKKRIYLHKKRLISGFTKKYNVTHLVYFEEHQNIAKAEEREKYLKGKTRVKKNIIVESTNPDWADLTTEIPE